MLPTFIVLYLRYYLVQENQRRDQLDKNGLVSEVGILEHVSDNSTVSEEVVDARQLDLIY